MQVARLWRVSLEGSISLSGFCTLRIGFYLPESIVFFIYIAIHVSSFIYYDPPTSISKLCYTDSHLFQIPGTTRYSTLKW